MSVFNDIYTQLFQKPPYPQNDFSRQAIIVTGANVGLGLEASKHFVRMGAEKVIVAVRSVSKGEEAKREIERDTKRTGVVEVWNIDYASYDSIKAFAAKVATLPRVDAAVLNAGIATEKYEVFEDNESTITVNVVSTTLLMLLLLPTLRASSVKWNIEPVLTVVGSGVHAYTPFTERNSPNSFDTLNDEKTAKMKDRYLVSKLLQLFAVREIADRTASRKPFVIVNTMNPGLCHTALTRSATGSTFVVMKIMRALMAWTAEEGSRTLVHATVAGPESHGIFLSNALIVNKALGKNVSSPEGQSAQKKVWGELVEKLEAIQPGLTTEL
ncbi:MAG: hypothetical protein Q9187_000164 [Circinaria calcarea]